MENWTWGLSLIVLTMAIHTTGIAFLAFATERIRVRLESLNRLRLHRVFAVVIGLIGMVGLILAALHGTEAALWAAAYWWLGPLNSPGDAILLPVYAIITRDTSGLMFERHWRRRCALEDMDGMLLFGISTAYIFTVMQACWAVMIRSHLPAG